VSMRKAVHVRIPVIPGVNDRSNIILDTIKFLKDISGIKKINLLPYHKIGAHKYERLGMRFKAAQIEEPSDAQMESIKKQFESAGFPVSIGG
jgi:pyruvate formate lyase activating enzyme